MHCGILFLFVCFLFVFVFCFCFKIPCCIEITVAGPNAHGETGTSQSH